MMIVKPSDYFHINKSKEKNSDSRLELYKQCLFIMSKCEESRKKRVLKESCCIENIKIDKDKIKGIAKGKADYTAISIYNPEIYSDGLCSCDCIWGLMNNSKLNIKPCRHIIHLCKIYMDGIGSLLNISD